MGLCDSLLWEQKVRVRNYIGTVIQFSPNKASLEKKQNFSTLLKTFEGQMSFKKSKSINK
jgi:hypothetical protein